VAAIEAAVTEYFNFTATYGTDCNPLEGPPCPAGDNVGAVIRLPFHDAFGGGGPNGCIDFDTAANNGLQQVVGQLNELREMYNFTNVISKADLYVLAANVATRWATTAAPAEEQSTTVPISFLPYTLELPFRYGRNDAATCDDDGLLPETWFTWQDTFGMFGGRFGMTVVETIAILGAHSVGRCEAANSGIDGGWTRMQSTFSNDYYSEFGDIGWGNDDGPGDTVWDSRNMTILLQSDVELLYNVYGDGFCSGFNDFASSPTCPYQNQTVQIFLEFADHATGNALFFGNYSTAYQKMTELYYDDSTLAEPGIVLTANAIYPLAVEPTTAPTTSPNQVSADPTLAPSARPTADGQPTFEPTPKPSSSTDGSSSKGLTNAEVGAICVAAILVALFLVGALIYYFYGDAQWMPASIRRTKLHQNVLDYTGHSEAGTSGVKVKNKEYFQLAT
jgi:hypothetical protein